MNIILSLLLALFLKKRALKQLEKTNTKEGGVKMLQSKNPSFEFQMQSAKADALIDAKSQPLPKWIDLTRNLLKTAKTSITTSRRSKIK